MRDRLDAPVLVGVGAAFDFHAGLVPQAPRWMQRTGLEWAVPARARAAPAVAALPALQPALRRRLRCASTRSAHRLPAALASRLDDATTSRSSGSAASGCRSRCPSPTAGCACSASTTTPSASRPSRARPDAVRGAGRRGAARARRRIGRCVRPRAPTPPQADAHRAHARHAVVLAHRDRHARHPLGRSTTCCRVLRAGPPARPALDGRAAARPSSSPATSSKHRGFEVGEDVFVAHVPERIAAGRFLEEIGTLPCIVGGVGEALGRARRRALFEPLRRADRADDARSQAELAKIWTNILRYAHVRAAQPADDGLRAVRRERLRGHRPDQPRLPARRDRRSRASPPGRACARTSPSPRSARTRRACCSPSRA